MEGSGFTPLPAANGALRVKLPLRDLFQYLVVAKLLGGLATMTDDTKDLALRHLCPDSVLAVGSADHVGDTEMLGCSV